MQGDPVADPSGIYYVPDSQPWCSRHHDGQYADRTYGGCLEGVVSTACEKDDYRHVAAFYGRVLVLTAMYALHMLEAYQEARIRSYLSHSGDANYMTAMLHKFNENILLWGNSGKDVVGGLPEFNQDYIFSYILNSYGLLAGIFVAAILAALVLFMFGAAARQKNELGMVMGFGCGMIILLNISLNFAGMLGWIPLTSTFLPFLSVGRNNILLCYALVGIILSIYRYKDVYPKKFKASQVSLQKTITLNLNM